MAESITASEFIDRMSMLAQAAQGTKHPVASIATALHEHLNAFEPTREALAHIIVGLAPYFHRPTSPPKGEVTDRPEPVITALQLLERVAAVIESAEVGETVEAARTRLAILAELAHLAGVALGRAQIGDWPKPKAAP